MTAIESDIQSSVTNEDYFEWGKEVPKELQEEATLVSKLSLDLFQKLKVHPNVYIPFYKDDHTGWCTFSWTNDSRQLGWIDLSRDIENEKGNKKEKPFIAITIAQEKDKAKPPVAKAPYVDTVNFKDECNSVYPLVLNIIPLIMPKELRKEAENLIKLSNVFFRKLVEHPDVIVMDGVWDSSKWESFRAYDEQGKLSCKIAFSDTVTSWGDRSQKLLIRA